MFPVATAAPPPNIRSDTKTKTFSPELKESLASVMWPELEGETGGLWGPDDEERLVLQLDNKNFDALDVQAGLWDADFDGREGLAEALLNGNWDRLMEIDDDESFSFSFEL